MSLHNPTKAFILLVALICITILLAVGRVSTEAGLPIITAIVFYGIGNGVAARSGISSTPVVGPKDKK